MWKHLLLVLLSYIVLVFVEETLGDKWLFLIEQSVFDIWILEMLSWYKTLTKPNLAYFTFVGGLHVSLVYFI